MAFPSVSNTTLEPLYSQETTSSTEKYSQDSIIQEENMVYLKKRFEDKEGILADLLNCLDTE